MREHPIPQDIVGYRFHIIGSMTLKQFAELTVGAILGLIIYMTNLPALIKWFLIFIAGAMGAAAAFLPIEERPLDHWISVFFKTLYQPTKFFWRRSPKIPDLFLFKAGQGVLEAKDEIDLTPARRQRIKDYLASVGTSEHNLDQYDQDLQTRLNSILQSFDKVIPEEVDVTRQPTKPNLKVRTRSLISPLFEKTVVVYDQAKKSKKKTVMSTTQVAKAVNIPEAEALEIKAQQASKEENSNSATRQQAVYVESTQINKAGAANEQAATFNASLPFPSKPTAPNKLVGMILTKNNELIPEAIVEIKDEQNTVVRAVKTNALGQFYISTPLKSGNYSIFVDHARYQFHPQEIILEDEIVEPIEIRSLG
ncbi:PrgI family protein [Patescibacteria group bacterium]|nr:PrgI family protein [Patescibacteria group bacterium]MBU1966777.1 PrgI family protein [Patescibacteria group bacterium]